MQKSIAYVDTSWQPRFSTELSPCLPAEPQIGHHTMPPSGTTVMRDRPNQRWTQAEEAALRRGIAKCASLRLMDALATVSHAYCMVCWCIRLAVYAAACIGNVPRTVACRLQARHRQVAADHHGRG